MILDYIKGVIKKMFNKSDINKTFNINADISNDMVRAIKLWSNIYTNKSPWLSEDIKSLDIASQISNEFAKLTLLEFKSEITGSVRADYLNEQYKVMINNLIDKLERANAKGGMIFKPYVSNDKIYIDCITADNFVPTAFDLNGNITSAVFISQLIKGDDIFTRLELHKHVNDEYIIMNKAFKSRNAETLGNEIGLDKIEEWAAIEPEVVINHIDKPLFSYYKVPIANNIDENSPLGMSCFSKAINLIKEADKQFGRTIWEYEASEKAIFVDKMVMYTEDKNGRTRLKVAQSKKRLYQALDTGADDFFKEFSPSIRDEAFWRGLNNILRKIEFNCNLAYGTISDPSDIDKTATEIKSSKKRSYDMVCSMQKSLQNAFENLIYAMNILCDLYEIGGKGDYEVTYNWDDSILTDADKERESDLRLVSAGIMNDWEYRVKWLGETEEQAKANIPEKANVIFE